MIQKLDFLLVAQTGLSFYLMTLSLSSVILLHLDSVGPKALGMIFKLNKDLQMRSEFVKSTYLSFCQGHIWDGQKKNLARWVLIILHNWNTTLPIQM